MKLGCIYLTKIQSVCIVTTMNGLQINEFLAFPKNACKLECVLTDLSMLEALNVLLFFYKIPNFAYFSIDRYYCCLALVLYVG